MWGAFWEGRSLHVRAFWEGRSLNVESFLGGTLFLQREEGRSLVYLAVFPSSCGIPSYHSVYLTVYFFPTVSW